MLGIDPYSVSVIRNARQSSHDYGVPANFKRPTMDDLPVPNGSWQENFQVKQAKYNRHLIVGIVAFTVSMIAVSSSLHTMNSFKPMLLEVFQLCGS